MPDQKKKIFIAAGAVAAGLLIIILNFSIQKKNNQEYIFDKNDNITAMMRTTAYPTSVIAQMLTKGTIGTRGVMTPEQCVPLQPFLAELRARSIAVTGWLQRPI